MFVDDWFVALIPAHNEARRVASTVRAIATIPRIKLIVVVDDGSNDDTPEVAERAGAKCLRLGANSGKGSALNAGVAAIRHWLILEGCPPPTGLILADADLGSSAVNLARLLDPITSGRADLTIAELPAQPNARGLGIAMWLARRTLWRFVRTEMTAPLSGQRALAWPALGAVWPFAPGFAVEVAMTIDALIAGLRVTEVPVRLRHRPTGLDVHGVMHRASQGLEILAHWVRLEAKSLGRVGARRRTIRF